MNKDKLKKLARDPKLISGIYNYCDRWCERCQFTSRCLNFESSKEFFNDNEISDPNNKLFWEHLTEVFKVTHEMLNEMAKEQGIDLSQITVTEEDRRKEKEKRESLEKHPTASAANAYSKMAKAWLEQSEEIFKDKEKELNKFLSLELPETDPEKEAVTLKDAVEVITYYLYFIYVKIMRALHGKFDDEFPEILDDFPKDSDGSAKIALIAIDRSISAWGKLLNHLQSSEDEILNTLVHLERLRNLVESEFPDARNFVRPGFDE